MDVRALKRSGLFRPSTEFMWQWQLLTENELLTTLSIKVNCQRSAHFGFGEDASLADNLLLVNRVRLIFSVEGKDGVLRQTNQPLSVKWTRCHYGGERPWWVCPDCQKCLALLYLTERRFTCRHCLHLTYQSCNESSWDRVRSRIAGIYDRLAPQGLPAMTDVTCFRPVRPKGMHRATYKRLIEELQELQKTEQQEFKTWIGKMEAGDSPF